MKSAEPVEAGRNAKARPRRASRTKPDELPQKRPRDQAAEQDAGAQGARLPPGHLLRARRTPPAAAGRRPRRRDRRRADRPQRIGRKRAAPRACRSKPAPTASGQSPDRRLARACRACATTASGSSGLQAKDPFKQQFADAEGSGDAGEEGSGAERPKPKRRRRRNRRLHPGARRRRQPARPTNSNTSPGRSTSGSCRSPPTASRARRSRRSASNQPELTMLPGRQTPGRDLHRPEQRPQEGADARLLQRDRPSSATRSASSAAKPARWSRSKRASPRPSSTAATSASSGSNC